MSEHMKQFSRVSREFGLSVKRSLRAASPVPASAFTGVPTTPSMQPGFSHRLRAALLASLSLFAYTAANAQSVETIGSVTPSLSPNPSPSWDLGGANLTVGNGSNGTLTVIAGGAITGINNLYGGQGATGTIIISGVAGTGTPSVLSVDGNSYIGSNGTGAVEVLDGALFENYSDVYLGTSGGSGSLTVSGVNAAFATASTVRASYLFLGNGGPYTGTLRVAAGGQLDSLTSHIGRAAGSSGTAEVTGPGALWSVMVASSGHFDSSHFFVGYAGSGAVTVTNGGRLMVVDIPTDPRTLAATIVGNAVGSSGTITISGVTSDGTRSYLYTGKGLTVGLYGTGTMNVLAGALVETSSEVDFTVTRIGQYAGSDGTVLVSGAGSVWRFVNNAGARGWPVLFVGSEGHGGLTVENGGLVEVGTLMAGAYEGGVGRVTVSGGVLNAVYYDDLIPPSLGGQRPYISIGESGTGTMEVIHGGVVTSGGTVAIGRDSEGIGTVLVSGMGSALNAVNNPSSSSPHAILVGEFGTGALTIAEGGVVNVGSALIGVAKTFFFEDFFDNSASVGTLTIGAPAGEAAVAPGTLLAGGVVFGKGTGRVVFNHTSAAYSFSVPISGPGAVQTLAGTTVFTAPGAMTYSGPTLVDGGILRAGAVDVLSQDSIHNVGSAGRLDLAGFNQTVVGLSNAGLVTMGTNTAPGTVLTVDGDYVGNGGTIAFNTYLGADGSPSDRLVVNGTTSGSTGVQVVNAGGLGALTTSNGLSWCTSPTATQPRTARSRSAVVQRPARMSICCSRAASALMQLTATGICVRRWTACCPARPGCPNATAAAVAVAKCRSTAPK